jgi:hypothetical protein
MSNALSKLCFNEDTDKVQFTEDPDVKCAIHRGLRFQVCNSPRTQISSVQVTEDTDFKCAIHRRPSFQVCNSPRTQISSVQFTEDPNFKCAIHRGPKFQVCNSSRTQISSVQFTEDPDFKCAKHRIELHFGALFEYIPIRCDKLSKPQPLIHRPLKSKINNYKYV